MNIKEVIDYMRLHPYSISMGARTIANRLHCDDNLVREARKILQNTKKEKSIKRMPKILLFDLETAPMRAYVWSRWKQDITLDKTITESFIICWSAKWLYSNEVMSDTLEKDEILRGDDERICKSLWKLINEADVVIAHNGCVEKDTPILMKDFTWKKASELKIGEEIVAFDEGNKPGLPYRDKNGVRYSSSFEGKNKKRKLKIAKVVSNYTEKQLGMKVTFTNGESLVTTVDHYWLAASENSHDLIWRQTCKLRPGFKVRKVCDTWEVNKSYEAGWMSGFIDGEGSLLKNSEGFPSGIQWCQRPTVVKEKSKDIAEKLNIEYFDYVPKKNYGLGRGDCIYSNTTGGKYNTFKLLGSLQLNRLKDHIDYNKLGSLFCQGQEDYIVKSVEFCGIQEFAILSTSEHTYIADGFAMHNCNADTKWMNSRFIINNILPPKPYLLIDTLQIAKKSFGFSSNKLDALAGYFGIEHKADTDFGLWAACMDGKQEALDYMTYYNKKDVAILEEVYLRLRPWAKGLPSITNIVQDEVCPLCGSEDYEVLEDKWYYTSVGRYQLYRCKKCGGIFRDRFSDKSYKPAVIGLR